MVKCFTMHRQEISEFDVSELSNWMQSHPRAAIVSTAINESMMVVLVHEPPENGLMAYERAWIEKQLKLTGAYDG